MKIFLNLFKHSHKLLLSKTAINTYFVFLGNGLSAFFAFIFTVTYVRNLTYADVGYFSSMLSLLLLVSDLADMGIGTSMSRFLPPIKDHRHQLLAFLKSTFIVQLVIGSIFSFGILLFTNQISEVLFHTKRYNFFLQITAFGIFLTIIANFCQYALSALQKFIHVAFLSSFGGFIRVALLIITIIITSLTLSNTIYIQTFAAFILMIISVILLNLDFLKEKIMMEDIKKLLSFTYLLGIARGLTALASRLDVLMIIALRGPTEAGIYATASRIIAIYPLLSGSFSTVIAPRLSATFDIEKFKKFMIKVILATSGLVGTVLFLIIIAYPFMTILFGDKGIAAVHVFQLLLISMIFFVASIPAVSMAVYFLHKPQILTVNSVIQLVVVIFGNLILIPLFGGSGAAYSLILAYSVTLLFTSYLTYFYFRNKHG